MFKYIGRNGKFMYVQVVYKSFPDSLETLVDRDAEYAQL